MAVIGAAAGQAVINEVLFSETTAWTCPMNCRAIVTVIGGGGAGGASYAPSVGHCILTGGGGAGGVAKSLLTLSSGTSYTATVGAGGASVSGQTIGGNGGNSTFGVTGATVLMTANYGSGGAKAANNQLDSCAGGAGGAATTDGNIFNAAGGAGGAAACTAGSFSGYHLGAGGGGSAGIFGLGYRGGNATLSGGGYQKTACGGGAGVGGEGGDADAQDSSGNNLQVTAIGGTMFGKGWSPSSTTHKYAGTTTEAYQEPGVANYDYTFRGLYGQYSDDGGTYTDIVWNLMQGQGNSIFDGLIGSSWNATITNGRFAAGPGAGGQGYSYPSSYKQANVMGGLFGGAGGGATAATSGSITYGGQGSFGAGGGGASAYYATAPYSVSGSGGSGLVVISIVEYL